MADNNEGEQTVWWLRWLTRGVGTLGFDNSRAFNFNFEKIEKL